MLPSLYPLLFQISVCREMRRRRLIRGGEKAYLVRHKIKSRRWVIKHLYFLKFLQIWVLLYGSYSHTERLPWLGNNVQIFFEKWKCCVQPLRKSRTAVISLTHTAWKHLKTRMRTFKCSCYFSCSAQAQNDLTSVLLFHCADCSTDYLHYRLINI